MISKDCAETGKPRERGIGCVLADLEHVRQLVCTGRLFPERKGGILWRPPTMRQLDVARHMAESLRYTVADMMSWRVGWACDGTMTMRWVSNQGRVTVFVYPDASLRYEGIDYAIDYSSVGVQP